MTARAVVRPLCFDTPEYWESLARSERAFAMEDRRRRGGSVESIALHEANAVEYETRAAALRASDATSTEVSR